MKRVSRVFIIGMFVGVSMLFGCTNSGKKGNSGEEASGEKLIDFTNLTNPIINGYFADPSILVDKGAFYIYATIDPWGGDSLALFKSADFKNWERVTLNWPTKAQCTSPTSNGSMVWAPSVVKGRDGKFHMFVSVGSEIYAGISDSPEGPWKNVKEDGRPLITTQKADNIHTIDAEAFIDTDGQAYLYWGSGWDWKDGHCLVAKMNESMTELTSDGKDITPPNYFEAPYMIKRDGTYYLMYSNGKCTDSTYQVRYAVADNPYGPWTEGKTSPVLKTISGTKTYGPGHHSVLKYNNQYYIVYHRIADPANEELLREICVDPMRFNEEGAIDLVE